MIKKVNLGNFHSNLLFLRKTRVLNKKKKILEIGSGRGSLVNHLNKKGYHIKGTELDKKLIKQGCEIYGKLPIVCMNGEKLKFRDSSFDLVLSFDVFEHIPNTDKHLNEIKRVLRSGGYYLFGTPNKITNIPWEIVQTRSFNKYKSYHCSLHTFRQLGRRLRKHNFDFEIIPIPILNNFTRNKVRKKFGKFGLFLFERLNPDKWSISLRTNFYVVARIRK